MIKSHLPPNYARFIVPMTFNKLDLRDYLFHAYSVRTLHIRSSITQGKASKNNKGQLRREPSVKTMTVELTE
jgi:large subunit ribosomal protein L23